MAGGGVKPGHIYGATDDFGYHAIENASTVYDMWATVLHLMGINHEQLTYRFSGRDLRLTDVHGNVLHDVIA
jgi:phosphoglycerol transferase MdoB-like AlkP superfamily enzyme